MDRNYSDEYINKKLDSLAKSKFRGSFHLNKKMKQYVQEKGLKTIQNHASEIVLKRLKVYNLKDGKQTPMKQVHPVFIAQHACGCCCRGCLEKIHNIPKLKELDEDDIKYIVKNIMIWIEREIKNPCKYEK